MNRKKTSVRQHDITDCGAACLASISAYFGLEIPLSRIRQYASTDKKGTNILGMTQAAKKLGLSAKGVRGTAESLDHIPLPVIAHVIVDKGLHHYMVIYRVTPVYAEVMDPADGKFRKIPRKEFSQQWTGVMVMLMPDQHFKKGNRKTGTAKRFLFLLKPYKFILFQALFGAAAYTLIGLSTAIYVQLIIDYVILDGNTNLMNLLGTGMIALLILQIYIGVSKTVLTLKTGQLIDARLILGYYKHLLKLPQPFFDSMRVGEIVSRMNDAVKIRTFINDVAIQLAVNLFIILFSFGLMFTYYWKLGLLMLLIIPVYTIIYLLSNQLNRRTQRTLMENSAELESQLVESLQSISTIKQFGLEDYSNLKTETRFILLLKSVYRSGLNSVFSGNSSLFTSRLFTILLLWTGAYFVIDGSLTAGELLSFYTVMGYFTSPVSELVGMNKTIQDALIAGDRLFGIMDLEKESEESRVELEPHMIGDIEFRNIHFRYGTGTKVFQDFTLHIPQGKVTAIVGESGSGKSTIINTLQKLYPIGKGRILIGGLNIEHVDTTSLRSLIGTVPQKIDLFAGNVVENIAAGHFNPDMEQMIEICRQLDILRFIEDLPHGFQTYLGENGATLSGGQKQCIAIARALYKKPEILILDEATASLDSGSEWYVRRTVNLFREQGKTVILIAHRLSTVARADRICVLEHGQVAEQGTHAELLGRKGAYCNLWNRQVHGLNGNGKETEITNE